MLTLIYSSTSSSINLLYSNQICSSSSSSYSYPLSEIECRFCSPLYTLKPTYFASFISVSPSGVRPSTNISTNWQPASPLSTNIACQARWSAAQMSRLPIIYRQISRTFWFCSLLLFAITMTSTTRMFSMKPKETSEQSSPKNTMKPTAPLLVSTRIRQAARMSCLTRTSGRELSASRSKARRSSPARSSPMQASTLGLRWLKLSLLRRYSPPSSRITPFTTHSSTFLSCCSCEESATRTSVLFSSAAENHRQMIACSKSALTTLSPAALPMYSPCSSPISAITDPICSSCSGNREPQSPLAQSASCRYSWQARCSVFPGILRTAQCSAPAIRKAFCGWRAGCLLLRRHWAQNTLEACWLRHSRCETAATVSLVGSQYAQKRAAARRRLRSRKSRDFI